MTQFVERYLLPDGKKIIPNKDNNGFLVGNYSFVDDKFFYSLNDYSKIADIIKNPFSFILGNGGLGKSVFLTQIEQYLRDNEIYSIRINLRDLTSQQTLFEKIKNKNFPTDKETFILIDALDEAIDIGFNNISEIIIDAIEKYCQYNSKTKIIITCRDNQFPQNELVNKMKLIYNLTQEEDNYIYNLCSLREDDVIQIARNLKCNNYDDFIKTVKKLHIGEFAATPIMLPVLIQMYNNGILTGTTNQFDIFENLMNQLCEETAYRKNKAQNGVKKFIPPTKYEILFVASKIAFELKANNKSYISNDIIQSNAKYIEDFYKLGTFYVKRFQNEINVTKALVDYTLKTKIFERTSDGYCFAQKTYQDFLIAYYFYNMQLSAKDYKKFFLVNNVLIPNYTESISYLANKDIIFFNSIVHNSIEELISSSVSFLSEYQRKKIFKEYMNFYKTRVIFKHTNALYKLLYFNGIEKELKKAIKSKNNKIIKETLNFIIDNELQDFEKEIEKLIFDKNTDLYIRGYAIEAAKSLKYKNLINKIVENTDYFKIFMKSDSNQHIRGILLDILYPEYYSEQEILPLLVERKKDNYYGYYFEFIKHKLPECISEKNIKIFWKWFINHQDIRGITKGVYSEDTPFKDKLFEVISENLDNLMGEYIDFQLSQKYQYKIFSDVIFKQINQNSNHKINFIKCFIDKVDINYFEKNKFFPFYFNKEDIVNLFKLISEKEINSKQYILLKYIADNFCYYNFINSEKYDDIEEIYSIIMNNPILKSSFEYFFNGIPLDNQTLEPINQEDINKKKYHYADKNTEQIQENRKKEKEREEKYYSDTTARIKEELNKYKQGLQNDAIFNVIRYLRYSKNNKEAYNETLCFDVNNLPHWKDATEEQKSEIIEIAIKNLFSVTKNVNKYTDNRNINNLWFLHSFLYVCKEKLSKNQYKDILKHWLNVIADVENISIFEETEIKSSLIKDIVEYYPNDLCKIIQDSMLNTDSYFFKKFLKMFKDELPKNILQDLFNFVVNNMNLKNSNENFSIVIKYLFEHYYKVSDIENLLAQSISILKKSLTEKNVTLFSELVLISFKYTKLDTWKQVRKNLYKSSYCQEILITLYDGPYSTEERRFYTYLSDKELVELYKYISNKFPDVYKEYPQMVMYTPKPIKELHKDLLEYIKRKGNIQNIKGIKKEYLKNCPKNRRKISYDIITDEVKKNFARNKNIDIILVKKLEEKNYKKKKKFEIMLFNKITNNNINGNNNVIQENNINIQKNNNKYLILISIFIVILLYLFLTGRISFEQLASLIKALL